MSTATAEPLTKRLDRWRDQAVRRLRALRPGRADRREVGPVDRLLGLFGRCHLTAVAGLPLHVVVVDPRRGAPERAGRPSPERPQLGEVWGDRWESAFVSRSEVAETALADVVLWLDDHPIPDDLGDRVRPGALVVAVHPATADLEEIDRATDDDVTLVVFRASTDRPIPPSPLASARRGRMTATAR